MRVTKFGHSCLLIEEKDCRILFDPGDFSSGFDSLTGLDAILITHQHPDHYVPENIKKLVTGSPDVLVYADTGTQALMGEQGIKAKSVKGGDVFQVGGHEVRVFGEFHEVIHPDIPKITDVGYMIDDKF